MCIPAYHEAEYASAAGGLGAVNVNLPLPGGGSVGVTGQCLPSALGHVFYVRLLLLLRHPGVT